MGTELRLGVTMREVHATGYDEARDALARDWGRFLNGVLPEVAWIPIPNLGATSACGFCARWGVNALILTGGEDIGVSPIRDETERALLRAFANRDRPMLGVCRGLQLMWTEMGGRIKPISGHVTVRHAVRFLDPSLDLDGKVEDVNSYHALALRETGSAPKVTVFARAADGTAEGVRFGAYRMAGVMWHPERERHPSQADINLIRRLFGLDEVIH